MRAKLLFFIHVLLALEVIMLQLGFIEGARGASVVVVENSVKAEGRWAPVMEGNTTFVDGTTWCVAEAGVASQVDLQNALDWACGVGMADCSPVRAEGPCFHPDTLFSHASYAFNSYYQINGNSDVACNFGGAAAITTRDPSYGSCQYPVARPVVSSASENSLRKRGGLMGIVLLLALLG